MKNNTLEFIKKIVYISLFVILLIIFCLLLYRTRDNKLITDIKDFVKIDTKVLYISNNKNYSEYPIELFEKYEIEYLYINSDDLSPVEKTKLEKIINSKYLTNIIVIFENGKIKDAIIECSEENKLNKFLSTNEIIPEIIGDTNNIIDSVDELLMSDFSIIYLPYVNHENIESQDNIFKSIAKTYGIEYQKIDAFLLSKNQQIKLNTLLEISDVEDQILILVKNHNIVGTIRGICSRKKYLNELYNYNLITNNDDHIKYINYNNFENIILSDEKNIVVIGKDECKYCKDIINLFNRIIENNHIEINYLNIKNFETDESINVQEKLKELGYSDGFSTPLTLIIEKNKLLDYAIGISNEEYFVDTFKENGIIK